MPAGTGASPTSFLQGPGPSSSPTSPPTGCNDPHGCNSPPPAALYLYTFLSTLIILLLVSSGIIARTIVLRRQQQRAIANGTWIPPTVRLREHYPTRPRPIMFNAYAAAGKGGIEERWNSMQPFSVSEILPPATKPPTPIPLPLPQADSIRTPFPDAARNEMRGVACLLNPFPRPTPLPPSTPVEAAIAPPPMDPDTRQVSMAFLVSMPSLSPHNPDRLPYIEFAVLEAEVVDRGKTSEKLDGGPADLEIKT
ncbi:hypothetical protein C8R43DRAFT_1139303 [Mycena crocata]|nr:hypothetical protein C8R43DRAFT_1139303 [Mycena crocata]